MTGQSKFEITVPKSQLPPSTVKVITYSGTSLSRDVFQTHRALAVGLKIINTHASNAITVTLDNDNAFTIPASSLVNLDDVQFTLIDVAGTGTGQVLLKIIPLARMKSNQLVEVD